MLVKQKWSNVSVVTPAGVEPRDFLVEGDRIVGLAAPGTPVSDDWQAIDGEGRLLFPGMIDLLQHGFDEQLYNDVTPGGVAANSLLLPKFGVTGFLPSISCLPPSTLDGVLHGLSQEIELAQGARAIGIHSEGPCFGSPGAHNPENIQLPSEALARRMVDAAGGRLKAVTVAPELPGAQAFIRVMKEAGVSIHLGHSCADPEDVARYVGWGIDAVTHFYNVMRTLPPDESGLHLLSLTDALLAETGLPLGLICDGIHVHPKLIRMLAQLPADRVFLETDSNKYAGGVDTEFEFYPGYWVRTARGKAVRDRAGGLCGSSLTSDEAMRNYLAFGADLTRAAHAASLLPALVIGMDKDLGSLEVGKLADFVVLDPADLSVHATYIGGRSLYQRPE